MLKLSDIGPIWNLLRYLLSSAYQELVIIYRAMQRFVFHTAIPIPQGRIPTTSFSTLHNEETAAYFLGSRTGP
ncbi:uncharacterized protein A1O9_13032 [Exophiala aquamarina CBS 119918]|uniref:Uncharacterized protein n=1 Tax=Exophiala aquamarina CBS 119918 TaxID=1182545 RepID=A0A072NV50_9EURO|nr:uncharacterized protein A1O9_13032 [Exophiala aquamarina CBS 119918]KEF50923.1 hypothetical protein A1O9_13032 [Exophiala aquamarina CBS 119918]